MITESRFREQLRNERVAAYMSALKVDTSNVKVLFKLLDKDGSGHVSVDEFVENLLPLVGGPDIHLSIRKLGKAIRTLTHKTDQVRHRVMRLSEVVDPGRRYDTILI